MPAAQIEARTRVSITLPVNNARQEKAAFGVLRYIKRLRQSTFPVTGVTHSVFHQPVYRGFWWSDEKDERGEEEGWVPDKVAILFIDFEGLLDAEEIRGLVGRVREVISTKYAKEVGKPEDEIWVVSHHITRYH